MEEPEQAEAIAPFTLGDRVTIKHSSGRIGKVIELRGPLGPGGVDIFRVLLSRRPHIHVEVRADQLLVAPPRPAKKTRTKPKPEAI